MIPSQLIISIEQIAHITAAIVLIVQGLNKPAFDLSCGCSVDDLVNTTAINCTLAV